MCQEDRGEDPEIVEIRSFVLLSPYSLSPSFRSTSALLSSSHSSHPLLSPFYHPTLRERGSEKGVREGGEEKERERGPMPCVLISPPHHALSRPLSAGVCGNTDNVSTTNCAPSSSRSLPPPLPVPPLPALFPAGKLFSSPAQVCIFT